MKCCSKCKEVKPHSAFTVDHRYKRPKSYCKKCQSAISSARRFSNPNRLEKDRAGHLKKYGITIADYEWMLTMQNGGCAICGRYPKGRRLAVDHCHKTKQVRGLLCWFCNRGLGNFHDNSEWLQNAAEYLRLRKNEHKSK